MSALCTWRTVTPPCLPYCSPSLSLLSPLLRFFATKTVIGRFGSLSLTLTCCATHLPRMADSSLAPSDSRCSSVDPAYAEIIVVRHGETAWNVDGRIQGHLDVELNEVGRQQAASVADRLSREPNISVVYSSDLKRASETAQIIATSCGGLEVIKDPDLRERHLGDLQGLVLREAAKISPKAYQSFLSHRTDQDIPNGGESLDQLYQRCTSSLQRIGGKHKGQRVVVVTHGGVIRALYKRACPNGRAGGKVLNTSINIFLLSDGDEWKIETWGDVSHLNQTGFLKSGFGGDRTSVMKCQRLMDTNVAIVYNHVRFSCFDTDSSPAPYGFRGWSISNCKIENDNTEGKSLCM